MKSKNNEKEIQQIASTVQSMLKILQKLTTHPLSTRIHVDHAAVDHIRAIH